MRTVLALAGWPEARVPDEAWWSADAEGRPLVLAHGGAARMVPVASNETRSVHAALAGAVYNRRELQGSLGGRHAFAGRDDAEIVVHLYEERGIQCVNALRGAFAFALWDSRRRRLLLARDQLGLTPLYYAADRGRLAAASTLPPLLALPGLASAWDAAALDVFLAFGFVAAPATFHPAIRQLRPGELLVWEEGRARTQRYWHLSFPERRLAGADLPALFQAQTREALRLRQSGDVTGLLLSGGLGSAALLALAVAERRPPARAYTVGAGDDDDVRSATRLAARAGVEHVVVDEEPDWPVAVDGMLLGEGAPLGGPESAWLRLAAARAGTDLDVVLAGLGGEEIFGGSLPARAAERVEAYRRLPALARESVEVWARFAPDRWSAGIRRLVADVRLAPLEMYARAVSLFLPEERAELYTPEALAALGDARPWEVLTGLFAEAVSAGASETADTIHYVELALRLPARAAALAGRGEADIRFPLADHRLAQFVASVPAAERGSARERQLLLRGAVRDLPGGNVSRAHASPGLPGPADRAFAAFCEETLAPDRIAAQGVFRPEVIARLLDERRAGTRAHDARLWAIILATRWLAGVRPVGVRSADRSPGPPGRRPETLAAGA